MDIDIVRAWKDAAYRASLSTEEQALIPANPAGAVELSDAELELVHGMAGKKNNDPRIIGDMTASTRSSVCSQTALMALNLGLGLPIGNGKEPENLVCYA